MLWTDRQTNRQTDRQTDRRRQKRQNMLAGVIYNRFLQRLEDKSDVKVQLMLHCSFPSTNETGTDSRILCAQTVKRRVRNFA